MTHDANIKFSLDQGSFCGASYFKYFVYESYGFKYILEFMAIFEFFVRIL